jgi:Skp family chaperone for outer membrane proteins
MRHICPKLGIALLGIGLIAGGAVAQNAAPAPAPATGAASTAYPVLAPPTVAVVDTQRVLHESAAGRSLVGQLDTERRKFWDQYDRLSEELRTKENDFRRQRAVMAPDQQQEQGQALERQRADAQRILQDRQEAYQKAEGEAGNVIIDNMKDVVQQFASEHHIGMVMLKDAVLSMSDKNGDITDEVIQRLNNKLPSVTLNVPPPGSSAAAQGSAQPAAAPAKSTGKK